MTVRDLLYRISQKAAYHLATDDVKKRIAEINRTRKIITSYGDEFEVEGSSLQFKTPNHAFLLYGMDLFTRLLRQAHLSFQILDECLICRTNGVLIPVTTNEELFILNEIWVNGCYNVIPKTNKPLVVIDVGMNVAYASLFFSSQPFVSKVYAFEPFQPTYKQGLVNLGHNAHLLPKIQTHNFGLSRAHTVLEVDYSPEHRGRAGIWGTELVLEKIGQKNREKVELRPFNSVVRAIMENCPGHDFLWKIDCEGSEYNIFEGIDPFLYENTRHILMEWHKQGPNSLVTELRNNGFAILSMSPNSQKVGMIYAFK